MTTNEGTALPPTTLPPTIEECEDEIGNLTEDLDPVSCFTVLATVCDALDLDMMELMMKIKMDHKLEEGSETIVGDILEQSQSNYDQSVDLLYRAAILNAHAENLRDQILHGTADLENGPDFFSHRPNHL